MEESSDEIKRFLDSLPERLKVIEEGIDWSIQKEYLDYSHSFERGELPPEELSKIDSILHHEKTPDKVKKKALAIIAHSGSIPAFKVIKTFYENAEGDLKQWAAMGLSECKMFLEETLSDENAGIILTGLGGTEDKIRIFFLILPLENQTFNKSHHKIIRNEFEDTAQQLKCQTEEFYYHKDYVGLTALLSLDVAVATFMDKGIRRANEYGSFVLEHYYAGNTEIPDQKEIYRLIKIVREG